MEGHVQKTRQSGRQAGALFDRFLQMQHFRLVYFYKRDDRKPKAVIDLRLTYSVRSTELDITLITSNRRLVFRPPNPRERKAWLNALTPFDGICQRGKRRSKAIAHSPIPLCVPFKEALLTCLDLINGSPEEQHKAFLYAESAKHTSSFRVRFLAEEVKRQELSVLPLYELGALILVILNDLPETLFTNVLYSKFVNAFHPPTASQLTSILEQCPKDNERVIRRLLQVISDICQQAPDKKATLNVVCKCFGLPLARKDIKTKSRKEGPMLEASKALANLVIQHEALNDTLERGSNLPVLAPFTLMERMASNTNVQNKKLIATPANDAVAMMEAGKCFKSYFLFKQQPRMAFFNVFLDRRDGKLGALYWSKPNTSEKSNRQMLPLDHISRVYIGSQTRVFQEALGGSDFYELPGNDDEVGPDKSEAHFAFGPIPPDDQKCFSLVPKETSPYPTLNLCAVSSRVVSKWLFGLNHLMLKPSTGKKKLVKERNKALQTTKAGTRATTNSLLEELRPVISTKITEDGNFQEFKNWTLRSFAPNDPVEVSKHGEDVQRVDVAQEVPENYAEQVFNLIRGVRCYRLFYEFDKVEAHVEQGLPNDLRELVSTKIESIEVIYRPAVMSTNTKVTSVPASQDISRDVSRRGSLEPSITRKSDDLDPYEVSDLTLSPL